MTPRRHVFLLCCALGFAAPAHAQLHLPSLNLPLPQRIGPLDGDTLRGPATRLLDRSALPALATLRLDQAAQLLRRHPDLLEPDVHGEPVVRGEILAWSPSTAARAAAAEAGLTVAREQRLGDLDETMVVLRVPVGVSAAAMLERLRALDPDGTYDLNHIYTGSGAVAGSAAMGAPAAGAQAAPAGRGALRIGLVDGGVDTGHAVFRDAEVRRWGCDGVAHPGAHGTAVAALMVGHSERFRGVAPDATLYAADIYCDSPTGGSADRIAGALGWLARERVAVVNLSLVGPANAALERVVAAMVRRGHLLVAAVGNDGPAAPPLYPASYPGVVGVSAVDRRGRALPEAARGPQVLFAAPGNDMVSAAPGAPPYRLVRGTSYAAPIVAALLAQSLAAPSPAESAEAVAALARRAERADAASRDIFGHGIVGMEWRTDPSALR
jgi:subtilisin family serine protease